MQNEEEAEQIQESEFTSLSAIYDSDLVETPAEYGSLSKRFSIKLSASDIELKNHVQIIMSVKFTALYPFTIPIVSLVKEMGVSDQQLSDLNSLVQTKLKNLKGMEMIFEVASFIEDHLSTYNSAIRSGQLKSSHQSYTNRQQEQLEMEKEKELIKMSSLNESKILLLADLNQDLLNKVKIDLERKEDKISKVSQSPGILFKFESPDAPKLEPVNLLGKSGFFSIFSTSNALFTIRVLTITNKQYLNHGISSLKQLSKTFKSIQKIDHPNIIKIHSVSCQAHSDKIIISILEDSFDCTLESVLKKSGSVNISKSKLLLKSLASAVAHIHSLDLPHRDINPRNVVFDKNGELSLYNVAFHKQLEILSKELNFGDEYSISGYSNGWKSPESRNSNSFSKKDDIFCIGRSIIECLYGLECTLVGSLSSFVEGSVDMDAQLKSLLSSVCNNDTSKRYGIFDMLRHEFFGSEAVVQVAEQILSCSKSSEDLFLPPKLSTGSRYISDFDGLFSYNLEIDFLGAGGFGQVVKVRNKIDNRFYAIKKVALHPKNKDRIKLLREVLTLSRLHHEHVVRYFTAWVEVVTSIPKEDGNEWSTNEYDEEESDFEDDDWMMSSNKRLSIEFDEFEKFVNDNIPNSPPSRKDEYRMLYIQMEYCEGLTLRDLVDEGIRDDEAWRLFRQILEGLFYVHSQGLIHRDLKPSNVFLDSKNNVKLGDFGLATVKWKDDVPKNTTSLDGLNLDLSTTPEDALTRDIGTPLYTAEETLKTGKYNTKVDMFSLGIVFFEMLYPCSTGMQRAIVLRDLRNLTFPEDFDSRRFQNQKQIIQMLLSDNPKDRPSCQELLTSKLLPPKFEEQELAEAFRTLQSVKHQDLTFDFNNSSVSTFDEQNCFMMTRVISIIKNILEVRGAIEISAPLLVPMASLENRINGVEFIDSQGVLVQLPHDLTFPWCRYISRALPHPVRLRRYAIERVFRKNAAGGQPRSHLEVDYDIVSKSSSLNDDCEVILTALAIIGKFPVVEVPVVMINSTIILDAILNFAKVSEDLKLFIAQSLEKERVNKSISVSALVRYGIPKFIAEAIVLFDFPGEYGETAKKLRNILKDSSLEPVLSTIETMFKLLSQLNIKSRILFHPLFTYHSNYYSGNLMFQIGIMGKEKFDVLAAGGRYDHLLDSLRNPFKNSTKLCGVGFNLAVGKVGFGAMKDLKKTLVLIASVGKADGGEVFRMSIALDLWDTGISAHYLQNEKDLTASDILKIAQAQGCLFIVQIKHVKHANIIKLRNVSSRVEIEVTRETIVNLIKRSTVSADTLLSHLYSPPLTEDERFNETIESFSLQNIFSSEQSSQRKPFLSIQTSKQSPDALYASPMADFSTYDSPLADFSPVFDDFSLVKSSAYFDPFSPFSNSNSYFESQFENLASSSPITLSSSFNNNLNSPSPTTPKSSNHFESFPDKSTIKRAEEASKNGETKFQCEFPGCGRIFQNFASIKSHWRCHADFKKFSCDECDSRFRRLPDLYRHKRSLHAAGKPHQCQSCGKVFARSDALKRHQLSKNKPRGCVNGSPRVAETPIYAQSPIFNINSPFSYTSAPGSAVEQEYHSLFDVSLNF